MYKNVVLRFKLIILERIMAAEEIHTGEYIRCNIEKGIADVIFISKRSSVNKFNKKTLDELRVVVDFLKLRKDLKGVVFSSSLSAFIVGADITEFLPLFKAPREDLKKWLIQTHALFNDIEDLPVPTVAILDGLALGGGFELTLSCTYRIATKNAFVGLPEVKLGIFPGWGGTIRLPRVIGLDNAIEWIVSGKQYSAQEALRFGCVDSVVERDNL